jgi:hypothetical protein
MTKVVMLRDTSANHSTLTAEDLGLVKGASFYLGGRWRWSLPVEPFNSYFTGERGCSTQTCSICNAGSVADRSRDFRPGHPGR